MDSELVGIFRFLKMDLPPGKSAFLFGPRKIGKSTFLAKQFPGSLYFNLLNFDIYFEFSKDPARLRQRILSLKEQEDPRILKPIIIDEIQKIPALLDEIHLMIETYGLSFILCGSSARKLRRSSVNMLGGRAWSFNFYPFTYLELKDAGKWNLITALNQGLIASHYLSPSKFNKKNQSAYVKTYLKEEIQEEGIVRNLASFARFIDSMAFSHGELTNYSNIARDCGIDSKTVKEYYQILIDTLIGSYVYPYSPKFGRETISSVPKFYLFDVGVANYICHRNLVIDSSEDALNSLRGEDTGRALEHYVFMELQAYIGLNDLDYEIKYWRTKSGLEVDFIITELKDSKLAIEVKISNNISKKDLRALTAFKDENPKAHAYLVCLEEGSRLLDSGLTVMNIEVFLGLLWGDKVLR